MGFNVYTEKPLFFFSFFQYKFAQPFNIEKKPGSHFDIVFFFIFQVVGCDELLLGHRHIFLLFLLCLGIKDYKVVNVRSIIQSK